MEGRYKHGWKTSCNYEQPTCKSLQQKGEDSNAEDREGQLELRVSTRWVSGMVHRCEKWNLVQKCVKKPVSVDRNVKFFLVTSYASIRSFNTTMVDYSPTTASSGRGKQFGRLTTRSKDQIQNVSFGISHHALPVTSIGANSLQTILN